MNLLSEKALEVLQSCNEFTFTKSVLVANGFSQSEATAALTTLERDGLISEYATYVNDVKSYRLS